MGEFWVNEHKSCNSAVLLPKKKPNRLSHRMRKWNDRCEWKNKKGKKALAQVFISHI
jgi:hypothetical protein